MYLQVSSDDFFRYLWFDPVDHSPRVFVTDREVDSDQVCGASEAHLF